jgi:hypothetical protein
MTPPGPVPRRSFYPAAVGGAHRFVVMAVTATLSGFAVGSYRMLPDKLADVPMRLHLRRTLALPPSPKTEASSL